MLIAAFVSLTSTTLAVEKSIPFRKGYYPNGQQFMPPKFTSYLTIEWNDSNGKNLVVFGKSTATSNSKDGADILTTDLLTGVHVLLDKGNKILWKMNDGIQKCPVDGGIHLDTSSIVIKDLNNDGIGECCFLYRMHCMGDVSPEDYKLLLYDNGKKYAIRGTNFIDYGQGSTAGGKKQLDKAFDAAPTYLKDFASKYWDKFLNAAKIVIPNQDN